PGALGFDGRAADRRAAGVAAGLLGEDGVAGEAPADLGDDKILGAEVDVGHHVTAALSVDLLDAPIAGLDDLARLPGQIGSEGELHLPAGHGGMLAVQRRLPPGLS